MDAQTAVAVSMYKNGEKVPVITEATGLTEHQIAAAVTAAHIPFVADRNAAPAPPIDTAATLIAWGTDHSSPRLQRLAGQARAALADLQQAQRREQAVTAAEEEVRAAEQQLAAARQALRDAKGPGPKPTADEEASPIGRPDRDETARIRAWARDNGHQVAPVGLVPRAVVDAYRATQPAAA
ncbi:histone-like nucleoid-structuring protein Lsr2 [Kitasatospora sp. NPDC057965]|uniref:Lsr2 family DNA-binding protein n=1 Tax=Kitasatospora sp. NPDC057965 TaxID=3346291 RepID=UPI0036D94743